MKTVLTGIKATGDIHLGNYLGAIRPAVESAKDSSVKSLFFIADYHSLTSVHKADDLRTANKQVAACWIACGLDPSKTLIYRQSDIPEIFELNWILSCFTPKGFMNRAHAYKGKVASNESEGKKDLDTGINMGLFNYPVLMSADILMFDAHQVPVGGDQVQHIEFARDIAQKINNTYGEIFQLPEPVVKSTQVIGLDGQKMSKSYNNTIPIFAPEKKFRKLVMKIKTDSSEPHEPKETEGSIIFDLYKQFASADEVNALAAKYQSGIGWGDAKQILFEKMWDHFLPFRDRYEELMSENSDLEDILQDGAKRARAKAKDKLDEIRVKVGLNPLK